MGKDKRKGKEDGSTFDYLMGTGKVGKMMDRYGVEGTSYGRVSAGGTQRSIDDVKKDLADAMMNDYDTRRGMEAAAMSGNKDAKKFAKKGFKSGNILSAWDTMKDLKKEHVGGGGMGGAKNIAGLTHALVQHERDTFTQANDAKYASKEDLENMKQEATPEPEFDDAEVELSPEMQAAKDRVGSWMDSGGGGDVYGSSDEEQDAAAVTPADTEKYAAGQSYLESFKNDLKSKNKFVPNV